MLLVSDGSNNQLTWVSSIQNSTNFTISPDATFSSSNAHLYKTNAVFVGTAESAAVGTLVLKDIKYPLIAPGDYLAGYNSGSVGVLSTITRSNVLKNMSTFVQMYKYVGPKNSGSFVLNEQVFQSDDGNLQNAYAIGNLQSAILNVSTYTLYVTNQKGTFNPNKTIFGVTSGATMTLSTKYIPELNPLSGEIIYLEKTDPITRTNVETETIKFVFEF